MSAHKRNASVTELAASAILSTASSLSDLVYASSARLPSAPDGLYDHEAGPLNDGKSKRHAFIHEFIDGIQSQIKRGAPIHLTSSTLVRHLATPSKSSHTHSCACRALWSTRFRMEILSVSTTARCWYVTFNSVPLILLRGPSSSKHS
jgi:hypothetical protein